MKAYSEDLCQKVMEAVERGSNKSEAARLRKKKFPLAYTLPTYLLVGSALVTFLTFFGLINFSHVRTQSFVD